jgi:beta-lactamase regulating signal transducer with metallopeptidase domain
MLQWLDIAVEGLWRNAAAIVPVLCLVAVLGKLLPCRPANRHALWVVALAWFVLPFLIPPAPRDVIVARLQAKLISAAPLAPADAATERADIEPVFGNPFDNSESFSAEVPAFLDAPVHVDLLSRPAARLHDSSPRWLPLASLRDESLALNPASPDDAGPAATGAALEETTALVAAPPIQPPPRRSELPPPPAVHEEWLAIGRSLLIEGATRLAVVRDHMYAAWRALPRIPTSIWLIGLGAIAAGYAVRIASFLRALRRAVAAPVWVQREVQAIATRYGLRRVPETLMIDARISPLVWVGGAPLLVLPLRLWNQLDRAGRMGILCHELAHLARRDHWVCRVELLVSLVYWWNPLVWWLRRRIQEEADVCCDAWVTWLMPEGRRAYAEALLRTNVYLGASGRAAPPVGMGVTSAGAGKIARRLTMVMTQTVRPRPSLAGFALAGVLMCTGWLTAPAWSDPPAEAPPAEAEESLAELFGEEGTPVAAEAPPAEIEAAPAEELAEAAAAGEAAEAPDPFLAGDFEFVGDEDGGGGDAHARMESLAAQLRAMQEELRAISRELRQEQRAARTPRAPRNAGAPRAMALRGPTPPTPPGTPAPIAMRTLPPLPSMAGPVVSRDYKLPSGQLEAFTKLMVRDDVPIRVSPGDELLTVHATPWQHEQLVAFLGLLREQNPTWRKYDLPEGKSEALFELMGRSDVPIQVRSHGGEFEAHVTDAQHAALLGLIRLIHPDARQSSAGFGPQAGGKARSWAINAPGGNGDAIKAEIERGLANLQVDLDGEALAREISRAVAKGQPLNDELRRDLERELAGLKKLDNKTLREQMAREMQAAASHAGHAAGEIKARALEAASAQIAAQAEQLAEQAAQMAARALQSGVEAKRTALERAAEKLEQKAEELERKAEQIERDAEAAERDAERAQREAERKARSSQGQSSRSSGVRGVPVVVPRECQAAVTKIAVTTPAK